MTTARRSIFAAARSASKAAHRRNREADEAIRAQNVLPSKCTIDNSARTLVGVQIRAKMVTAFCRGVLSVEDRGTRSAYTSADLALYAAFADARLNDAARLAAVQDRHAAATARDDAMYYRGIVFALNRCGQF